MINNRVKNNFKISFLKIQKNRISLNLIKKERRKNRRKRKRNKKKSVEMQNNK